jgi:hypothetical protein
VNLRKGKMALSPYSQGINASHIRSWFTQIKLIKIKTDLRNISASNTIKGQTLVYFPLHIPNGRIPLFPVALMQPTTATVFPFFLRINVNAFTASYSQKILITRIVGQFKPSIIHTVC